MSELRRVKPVKASTLHAKAGRYRDGFVDLFREYEGAQVVTEDGEIMRDRSGRRVFVTPGWFAREMGVPRQTFHEWLNGRSVRIPDTADPDDQQTGSENSPICSCIPDPGCPVHGREGESGSSLADRHASGKV